MAILSKSSSNWLPSIKFLILSTVVLSAAMALKASVPVMVDFAVIEVPLMWSVIVPWLRPPFLYLVLNCIIITIAASSMLQSRSDLEARANYPACESAVSSESKASDHYELSFPPAPENAAASQATDSVALSPEKRIDGLDCLSRSPESPQGNCSGERDSVISTEKPLVSTRFGHRKAFNNTSPNQGGSSRALRVSRPKRQDTLESTWKTITEGRPIPLTRHLKKSDTWESHVLRHGSPPPAATSPSTPPQPDKMRKSETFTERASAAAAHSPLTRSPGSGKLRKEPSLSQDELNRRVEAFIKKFNEEMRLQRQESLQQYQVMVGLRGVH